MSSPYPILGNRPIDQWKVTELKEELKKRKLTTSGLKLDLIKRLDEALRIERETAEKDVDNSLNHDPKPIVEAECGQTTETVESAVDHGGNKIEIDSKAKVQVGINNSAAPAFGQVDSQGDKSGGSNTAVVEQEPVMHPTILDTNIKVTETVVVETVVSDVALSTQDTQNPGSQEDHKSSKSQLENLHLRLQLADEDPKLQLADKDPKTQVESEDSKPELEDEGLEPSHSDVVCDSALNNQVPEVSPSLGFQVKSDSISADSVSINENIELKDNIIADNVKLELDIFKPDMVDPSSRSVVPVSGEAHPMDLEEPLEKEASVEERDDKNTTNSDLIKKNDCEDLDYSEKLNLDRSSGDESMEEDVLELKQIDSKSNTEEVGDMIDKNLREEVHVDVVGDDLSAEKMDILIENKSHPVEKKRLQDQEAVGNNEPSKRRRWNSEKIRVPEQPSPNHTPTTTHKLAFQPAALKRNFSRSDSTASNDASKEQAVPPSQKPPTTSLRIDRFLRPFTLKAVQELLGKTGNVTSFWMDQIKTHCYVTYSSVEEAIETRNAIYNLQWPPNGGQLLVAEFVDPQEVKMRLEALPQTPSTPGASKTAVPPSQSTKQPEPLPRQQVSRQQLPPPSALPPPPPLSSPSSVRERLSFPPPPPEKIDPPIVTLDDLFQKTKATPRIYYLPLSEEQVAAKLAARGNNTRQ
ncbi:hypothetical protein SLEP1_g34773 [Rubroshorea leprosula]|nr:hypothetical protein SLEP1_g34773 [Rubroshorea leprosula]